MHKLPLECKKDSLRQMQDGTWKLGLTVHPNDMHTDLMTAAMGTRYAVAMVEIGDDEQPVERIEKPKEQTKGDVALIRAGILASNPEFHEWGAFEDEDAAVTYIRNVCGVKSRREIAKNADALEAFERLETTFQYRDQI